MEERATAGATGLDDLPAELVAKVVSALPVQSLRDAGSSCTALNEAVAYEEARRMRRCFLLKRWIARGHIMTAARLEYVRASRGVEQHMDVTFQASYYKSPPGFCTALIHSQFPGVDLRDRMTWPTPRFSGIDDVLAELDAEHFECRTFLELLADFHALLTSAHSTSAPTERVRAVLTSLANELLRELSLPDTFPILPTTPAVEALGWRSVPSPFRARVFAALKTIGILPAFALYAAYLP